MRLELMIERGAGGASLGNRAKRVRNLVSTDRAIARRFSRLSKNLLDAVDKLRTFRMGCAACCFSRISM
jgi:hypothetical protein